MGVPTKAELAAEVKRVRWALGRSETRVATLEQSLARANEKIAVLQDSVTAGREREKATAEILRVISRSPSDPQPVFDAIAEAALRLVGGVGTAVTRVVDDVIHLAAFTSTAKAGDEFLKSAFPRPLSRATGGHDRVVRSRAPYCVSDTEHAQRQIRDTGRARGFRSAVFVPLLRNKVPIGTISVSRRNPGAFGRQEIELLETFADQAVIAIENARLFNETKEALAHQAATADILKAISTSPTDTQPVFDAIVRIGVTLFDGANMSLRLVKGDHAEIVASTWPINSDDNASVPIATGKFAAIQAIRSGEVVHVPDTLNSDFDPGYNQRRNTRSIVCVPLLSQGKVIGVISVFRPTPGPFTDKQIALLETFADQAVIAIENVRLFKELQARNAELTESLEQQTATSEILRIISSSPTDTQPVFDAIVTSGSRLLGGYEVTLRLVKGEQLLNVSRGRGTIGEDLNPAEVNDEGRPGARCIALGEFVDVPDFLDAEPWVSEYSKRRASLRGRRANSHAPLLLNDRAIGALSVSRENPGPLSHKHVALLKTFAVRR